MQKIHYSKSTKMSHLEISENIVKIRVVLNSFWCGTKTSKKMKKQYVVLNPSPCSTNMSLKTTFQGGFKTTFQEAKKLCSLKNTQ